MELFIFFFVFFSFFLFFSDSSSHMVFAGGDFFSSFFSFSLSILFCCVVRVEMFSRSRHLL
jgi:hypothetical protein